VATSGDLIQVSGQSPVLVKRLTAPLQLALAGRHSFYRVDVDTIGRVGEVLISITGSRGHLPLIFGEDELDPGYVFRVVTDTVSKFGL
jgi:hypothetical protein